MGVQTCNFGSEHHHLFSFSTNLGGRSSLFSESRFHGDDVRLPVLVRVIGEIHDLLLGIVVLVETDAHDKENEVEE